MPREDDKELVADAAKQLFGAMTAREPHLPLRWATFNDLDGEPILGVAVVLGRHNTREITKALEAVQDRLGAVVFLDHDMDAPPSDGPDGGASDTPQPGGTHANRRT